MIPDFALGIVKVERGEAETLPVGNLAARRDFTHVKDIVRAYRLIAEKGKPGEVYNVGSGKTWSAGEVSGWNGYDFETGVFAGSEKNDTWVKIQPDIGTKPNNTPLIII